MKIRIGSRSHWILPWGVGSLRIRALAIVLAALASVPVSAATAQAETDRAPLALEDFAFGRDLISQQAGRVQSVVLDYDVYRRSVGPRLSDLRVFDAKGRPAPYAVWRRMPARTRASEESVVPIFRLERRGAGEGLDRTAVGVSGDYRIDAELSATGAIVRIHRDVETATPAGALPGAKNAPAAGWLLDTSGLRRSIVGLEVELAEAGGDFVSRLRLESSNDLAVFRRVDTEIALARLDQAGHRIERTDFKIPSTRARYLRLTPIDAPLATEIVGVRVRSAPERGDVRRERRVVAGRFDPHRPGVVLFDVPPLLPIESVHVQLAEPDSIVEGRLESASSSEGPWRVRQQGLFYLLEKGGALRNPKAEWNSSSEGSLRLVTSARGGGLLGEAPSIEVVWRAEQLLYLQRNPGDMALGVGRIDTENGGFEAGDLLQMDSTRRDALRNETARLGPERTLAGLAALERVVPVPWRRYGLWLLLLGSVALILVLSVRVLRAVEE